MAKNSVSLRDYIDLQAECLRRELKLRDESVRRELTLHSAGAKEALEKKEIADNAKFAAVNEFRGALSTQTATFIPRAEVEARDASIAEKVTSLTDRINQNDGRGAGLQKGWGIILASAGLIFGATGMVAGVGTFVLLMLRH